MCFVSHLQRRYGVALTFKRFCFSRCSQQNTKKGHKHIEIHTDHCTISISACKTILAFWEQAVILFQHSIKLFLPASSTSLCWQVGRQLSFVAVTCSVDFGHIFTPKLARFRCEIDLCDMLLCYDWCQDATDTASDFVFIVSVSVIFCHKRRFGQSQRLCLDFILANFG